MGDDAVEREVDYWRGALSGAPPLLELLVIQDTIGGA